MIFPNWTFHLQRKTIFLLICGYFGKESLAVILRFWMEVMQKNNKKSQVHCCGGHLTPCFSLWSFTLPPAAGFFFHLPWQWEQSWHEELEGLGMGCTSVPSELRQHFRPLPAEHWAKLLPCRSRVLQSGVEKGYPENGLYCSFHKRAEAIESHLGTGWGPNLIVNQTSWLKEDEGMKGGDPSLGSETPWASVHKTF